MGLELRPLHGCDEFVRPWRALELPHTEAMNSPRQSRGLLVASATRMR